MKCKKIKQLLLNLSKNWPSFVRKQVLRIVGFGDVEMRKNVQIDSYRNVKFGQGVFVNYGTQFYTSGGGGYIIIGNNVDIGPNVHFCCASHKIGNKEKRASDGRYLDIRVGDGTWICMDSVVLPGVTIGKGVVIAAGSIVNHDVPDNELWGGNPAVKIRSLE